MSDKATAGQMQVATGILITIAACFIAFGLGKMFGAGVGWLLIGIFVFFWAKAVRDGIKRGEYGE